MTVQTFTIPIDGVPDGWEPVEYRAPVKGSDEPFLNYHGEVIRATNLYCVQGRRLILRKKYTPPAWLKEAGFKAIFRSNGRWYASVDVPESQRQSINGLYGINQLNFTPPDLGPDVQDKDTLIEL